MELAARHAIVGTTRGYGMFQGLEIVHDQVAKTPISPAQARHLTTLIAEEGLIIGTSGIHGNVIKIRPPLVAECHHVDRAVDSLDRALKRFSQDGDTPH